MVVLLAVAVSMLLLALQGSIEANLTQLGVVTREIAEAGRNAESVRSDPTGIFQSLKASQLRSRFLYRPAVALCVGLVVGFLGRGAPRRVAVLAMLPFLALICDNEGWDVIGIPLSVFYLGLALTVVQLTMLWRGRATRMQRHAS
jgi:hypothetical protein